MNYTLDSRNFLYAFVATGHKQGGLNGVNLTPLAPRKIKPEDVTDFEAGWKAKWLGGHLRTQLNGYYTIYKDFQVTIGDPAQPGLNSILNVAGDTDLYGFEASGQAVFGALSFDFGASVSNSSLGAFFAKDARFATAGTCDSNVGPATASCINLTGRDQTYSPPLTLNGGVQYVFAMPMGATLTPRVDYAHIDPTWATLFENRALGDRLGPRDIVNLQLTYELKTWRLTGYSTNLTDLSYTSGINSARRVAGAPRQYGVRLQKDLLRIFPAWGRSGRVPPSPFPPRAKGQPMTGDGLDDAFAPITRPPRITPNAAPSSDSSMRGDAVPEVTPVPPRAAAKPKPRSKSEQRAEMLEQIFDAAEYLFSRHGLYGVTLKDVAARVGVHTSLLHYYFDSKQALFDAVIHRRSGVTNERRMAALERYEQETGDHPTVEGALHAYLDPDLDLYGGPDEGLRNFAALGAMMSNTPSGGERMDRYFDPVVLRLVEILKKALPDCPEERIFWGYHFVTGALMLTLGRTGRIDRLSGGLCSSDDFQTVKAYMADFMAAGFHRIATSEPPPATAKPRQET